MEYMEHPPPMPLNQYTMFQIGILLKCKSIYNTFNKKDTILWYNITIKNRYKDRPDIISILHHPKSSYTLNYSTIYDVKKG